MEKNNSNQLQLVYEKDSQDERIIKIRAKYQDNSFSERVLKVLTIDKKRIEMYEKAVVESENIFSRDNSRAILKPVRAV